MHHSLHMMQRVESEVARLRIQVGSTEHSHAALEATVQGQLDACVRHVEKRLFEAAQAKVRNRGGRPKASDAPPFVITFSCYLSTQVSSFQHESVTRIEIRAYHPRNV
jgi:hypothetical protein